MSESSWVGKGGRASLYVFGVGVKVWRILVLPGSGHTHCQCPYQTPTYQDIPLCRVLAGNLQDMLILGAVILLCILFLSFFLLPKSLT